MKCLALRQASLLGFSLVLAACGARDGSPVLPTSAKGGDLIPGATAPVSGVGTFDPSTQVSMQASVGAPPAGFVPRFRSDPRPDADGVIRGDSPLTVKFDLCGSKADADKTLFFLFDWDFDDVANVVGTGDGCEQEHRYRLPQNATDGNLETNVCVVNGNPRGPDPGKLFFSCRTYRIALPVPPPQQQQSSGCINNPKWMPVTCTTPNWVWSSNRAVATTLAAANAAHVLETGCSNISPQPAGGQGLCSLDGTGWVSTQTFIMSGCNASWSHIGGSFTGNCGNHDGDTTRHLVLGVNDCFDY